MPNHVHVMINFIDTGQSINMIVGNGKGFMAYNNIKRLTENNEHELSNLLSEAVDAKRKDSNKKHEVWELSFDWKACNSNTFTQQKLDNIHINPCKEKRNLCAKPVDYKHSSPKFYLTEKNGFYKAVNIAEMNDKIFTSRKIPE